MKSLALAVTLVGLLAWSSSAQAAEGAPSEQVLSEMGLAGMQVMSDAESATVRGKAFFFFDTHPSFLKYQADIAAYQAKVLAFRIKVNTVFGD